MTTASRRSFLSTMALAGFGVPLARGPAPAAPGDTAGLCVTDFGAVGDGATPCGDAFQAAIDAAEDAGGGTVSVPAGTFILEKTPLVASRVHLMGAGAGTVLRGRRPGDAQGAALVSNKGQQASAYDGAHDWSISHLAIDSPDTNGIVVTHARNVYIGHIYGIDVYDHFVDTAGLNILCENLFLTGRSGASSFQIDSLSGAQTIWDGDRAIAPLYDGTDTENLILRGSIITAAAGHTGTDDKHDSSIHFHGDDARSFLFADLIIGGARYGFYQDAGSQYRGIQIHNVRSTNPGHAVWLGGGRMGQRGLLINGLCHEPAAPTAMEYAQQSIYFSGREDVQLAGLQLRHATDRPTDYAIRADATECVLLSQSILSGNGGVGFLAEESRPDGISITGCAFRSFGTGIIARGTDGSGVRQHLNAFVGTEEEVRSTS